VWQSKRYVEIGSVLTDKTKPTNKLKRRRSQYFVSAEAASVLSPAELIREAELELTDESDHEHQAQTVTAESRAQSNGTDPEDFTWSKDDWKILHRCYRKTQKSARAKGKGSEADEVDEINVENVKNQFVFKKGITQAQLREGKWNE
jgi:hypothetical protein